MAGKSPTQRALADLRADGYLAAIVERWNPYAKIRQDLFGCIDLLALGNRETLAVQVTSTSVAERVRKLQDSPALPRMREANWRVQVWGYRKNSKGRYIKRIEDIS